MSDEEFAKAISDCLEPLLSIAEQHPDFDAAFDEAHLALMKLFDDRGFRNVADAA